MAHIYYTSSCIHRLCLHTYWIFKFQSRFQQYISTNIYGTLPQQQFYVLSDSDVSSLSFSGFGRARAFHFLNFSGFGRTRLPTFRARAGFEFIKRASGGYWAFTTSKHNYFFHNLRKAKTQFIKIYEVWVMKSFLEKFFCINLLNKQNYSMLQILEL